MADDVEGASMGFDLNDEIMWPAEWSEDETILNDADGTESALVARGVGEELVFDWNKIITAGGRYVEGRTEWKPDNPTVRVNTDWNAHPNFSKGTLQFRVIIRKMAKKDQFKLFYNHWQHVNGKKAEMVLNTKQLQFSYNGTPITRTFSVPVRSLRSVHTIVGGFVPFSWSTARDLVGFFPPNWSGPGGIKLDPGVYPIDLRFTVVVVAPGATFSGWNNY